MRVITRTCQDCGAAYETVGTQSSAYCGACRLERKRKAARDAYYRGRDKRGGLTIGDILTDTCCYCEQEFTYPLLKRRRHVCDDCTKRRSGQARSKWMQANPDSVAAIKRRWAENNREKVAEVSRRRRYTRYKVPPEWEAETLERQGGKCGNPACGATEPGGRWRTWNIDHDHISGRPRGLLCSRCNKGVGLFDDDVAKLLGMIEYIRRHQASVADPAAA